MEFYALNQEQLDLLKEIRLRISRLQSGGTVDSIASVGGDIKKHLGASFISLKQLAMRYEANDKIASILWSSGFREQQIVATFLFTEKVNKEKITQLLETAHSYEIVEYLGAIFLAKHPQLPIWFAEFFHSNDDKMILLLISASAKHFQLFKGSSLLEQNMFENLINRSFSNRYLELVAERYRFHC